MKITSATLRQIATMPEQAMVVALTFLAEQLEKAERRQAWDRERKSTQKKMENERKESGIPQEISSRVCVNNNLTTQDNIKNTPPTVPPKPSKPKGGAEHPAFARFWAEYPPREGNKDRKAAVKAFDAALRRCDPDTIIDGAFRYRVFLEQKGERQFVRQARTWLNADGWTETYDISASKALGANTIAAGVSRVRDAINRATSSDRRSRENPEPVSGLLESPGHVHSRTN